MTKPKMQPNGVAKPPIPEASTLSWSPNQIAARELEFWTKNGCPKAGNNVKMSTKKKLSLTITNCLNQEPRIVIIAAKIKQPLIPIESISLEHKK